jgi:hypothetical protein
MNRHSFLMVVCATLVYAILLCASTEPLPCGFIESISGDAILTVDRTSKKLDAKKDAGRVLYPGDQLQCAYGAQVLGYLTTGSTKGFSQPFDLCHTEINGVRTAQQNGLQIFPDAASALNKYGKAAGRPKGVESAIYAPPNEGAVLPAHFVVRWRTRPPLTTFTAVLQDGRGTELASVPGVDGKLGILDSEPFRNALMKYRTTTDNEHAAKLIFHFDSGPGQSVSFTVLTEHQEQDLEKMLGEATVPSGLFGYIRRAAIFESFRLFDSVAAEYDAALKEAPESRDLLRAALNAYSRIGDLHRARELSDRLQQVDDNGTE